PPVAHLVLLVPLLLVLGVLAAAEWTVRRTRPPLGPLEFFVTAPKQQAAFIDRDHVSIFEGDPLLLWRLRAGLSAVVWDGTLVTTNSQGLRYARPVGAKP